MSCTSLAVTFFLLQNVHQSLQKVVQCQLDKLSKLYDIIIVFNYYPHEVTVFVVGLKSFYHVSLPSAYPQSRLASS